MIFKRIKTTLLEKLPKRNLSNLGPNIRARQLAYLGTAGGLVVLGSSFFLLGTTSSDSTNLDDSKEVKKTVADLTTPLKAVDEREIWVSRVEKKTEEVKEKSEEILQENQILQKRIDIIEDLFKSQKTMLPTETVNQSQQMGGGVIQSNHSNAPETSVKVEASKKPKLYPVPETEQEEEESKNFKTHGQTQPYLSQQKQRKKGPKIAHIGGKLSGVSYRTKDLYLPAGSYSKAVILSGVVASTATNSQGNPQPVMMRLVDDGNLPRGFKSRVKDAVILGGCYGDISSERAYCRLETMSWVEPDGTTVEKQVEGWVFGEDGRAGLKGEVVDRSSDVARQSFGAGLLSAAANFFKMESSRGVYPVSPFGQTNPMSNKEALQGAAASGVGSALDKLADFSIKRAEQMQPVIMISSGRVIDVAFKTGVDLSAEVDLPMKVAGKSSDSAPTNEMGDN